MAKHRPFKNTTLPDPTGKGPNDLVSRRELVAFLASRVGADKATLSTKVYDDMQAETLRESRSGFFTWGDVHAWASRVKKWRKDCNFGDLPAHPIIGRLNASLLGLRVSFRGHTLPQTLPDAHTEIEALLRRIIALEQKLAACESQLKQDAPAARKWRDANFHKTKGYRDRLRASETEPRGR